MASAHKIGAVSTLADLLSDPERISALPKDVIAELRGQIAKLDTLLLSRLLAAGEAQTGRTAIGCSRPPKLRKNLVLRKTGCTGTRTHCPLRCEWERSISVSARREWNGTSDRGRDNWSFEFQVS